MGAIRVSVVGQSGAGKSTFAQRLSERLGIARLELDGVFHQEDWRPLPVELFRTEVFEFVSETGSWVVDGNYGVVRPIVWSKSTHVVWLDLPKIVFMRRLIGRSVRRIVAREQLWNGNREGVRNLFSRDVDENVVLHAWQTYAANQTLFGQACLDEQWRHVRFIRVRNDREVEKCLDSLSRLYEVDGCLDG